jgi:translation initiation factor 2 subunit 3
MPQTKSDQSQPEVNIGLIGHVDHGKTTLTERLSGKWTDTHFEEMKRGITIKLGYANTTFYKFKNKETNKEDFTPKTKGPNNETTTKIRDVSFIDAPGHESLMATMISGAAIMDGAVLLIAANEKCPQPQTEEHLMALEIIGCKNIVIAQNKVDLVTAEQAKENYEKIKEFVKGTIAEKASIIPISAQQDININHLIKAIEETIKTPKRDNKKPPLMFIARSFDVNKPGIEIENILGGVLGGSLKQGILKAKDKITILPGISEEKEGKTNWKPITSIVQGLKTGNSSITEAGSGGSIAVLTSLDPYFVKGDALRGNVLGLDGKMPPVWHEFTLNSNLLERVVGEKESTKVQAIKLSEPLMLNVNSAATIGVVTQLKKDKIHVKLKIPVCCTKEDRITISRMIGNRWRLIGYGTID